MEKKNSSCFCFFVFVFFPVCLGFEGKKCERSGIRSKTELTRRDVNGEYI